MSMSDQAQQDAAHLEKFLIVAVIYWFAVQRKKPWSPPIQPDEDLSGIAATASPPAHTES